mgnify:CR=1 FL=1|jgi:hypothetical protein
MPTGRLIRTFSTPTWNIEWPRHSVFFFSHSDVLRSSRKVGGVGFMQKRNDALFDASKLKEAR